MELLNFKMWQTRATTKDPGNKDYQYFTENKLVQKNFSMTRKSARLNCIYPRWSFDYSRFISSGKWVDLRIRNTKIYSQTKEMVYPRCIIFLTCHPILNICKFPDCYYQRLLSAYYVAEGVVVECGYDG